MNSPSKDTAENPTPGVGQKVIVPRVNWHEGQSSFVDWIVDIVDDQHVVLRIGKIIQVVRRNVLRVSGEEQWSVDPASRSLIALQERELELPLGY